MILDKYKPQYQILTFGHVGSVNIQIYLRMRVVWWEFSQGAFWIAKDRKFLHAGNEDSHMPAQMRRLICIFVGRTYQKLCLLIQSNFDGSNTDGSFTMAYSNSFLSPYGFFSIAQEHIYWRKFSYFIKKLYVVCTH